MSLWGKLTDIAIKADDTEDIGGTADGVAVEAGVADWSAGSAAGSVLQGGGGGDGSSDEGEGSEELHFEWCGVEEKIGYWKGCL